MPTNVAWNLQHHITDFKGAVNTAVFSSGTGNYLIAGGSDRTIRLFNPRSKTLIKEYHGHGYEIFGIQASHDNTRLASCGGDRSVFYWDVATAQPIKRFTGHTGRVNAVAFNSESTVLASGSWDSTVKLWDLKSQQRMPIQSFDEAKDSITSMIISSTDIITGCVDGHVRHYDLRNGQLTADYFDAPVTSISLTKDGKVLLVSTLDNCIRLIDANNGKLLNKFTGHSNASYRIHHCFDSREECVIAGDEQGDIYTWDHASAKLVGKQPINPGSSVAKKTCLWTACHPSKSEKMLVTASTDGVRIWSRE